MQMLTLLQESEFYAILHTQWMYVVYFLKISWVDKNWKMVKYNALLTLILLFNLGMF